MKKGLAVFSGSAVVHKLMQDGTVVLGTAANPAAVTISGSLTASANSIEVGNVSNNFTASTLGGILVELKSAATSGTSALSSSLKTYIDAQDSAEATARAAGDVAVASTASANLNSVSSSLKTYIDGIDAAQTSANSALSGAFNTRVGTLESTVQSIIGDNTLLSDITGTLNSIKEIAEYLDGDGTPAQLVADLSTEVNRISGALVQEVSDRVTAVSGVQTNLDSVSGSLKAAIDAIGTSASGDTSALSSSLKAYIDGIDSAQTTANNNLSSSLKSYVDAIDLAQTTANSTLSSSLSSAIAAEASRASTAEAGLQSQIDGAQISINGIILDPFASGALSIVTGSANLTVVTSSGNVVVDLASAVNVGSLTATGSVTVTGGDLVASHGAMKATLDSTADSTRLAALSDSASLASGSFDGMSFYLKGSGTGAFARANCWYFCQDGVWFDAPFFAGE